MLRASSAGIAKNSATCPKEKQKKLSSPPVTLFVVGAGHRGNKYANYAVIHPDQCRVVAVAEPRESPRLRFQKKYDLPDCCVFSDWRDAIKRNRLADIVVIATQDRDHEEPAVAFANRGDYAILLEKPIAPTLQACRNIIRAVKKSGCIFSTGYVMRYTAYSRAIKDIIDREILGDIVCVQHMEPVGGYHFAHSYVRGHWRKESESSSMLLAKSCHDIDWLCWIMGSNQNKCNKISSYGSLYHFRSENKPEGASERCVDCPVEKSCAWSAKRHYLDPMVQGEKTPFLAKHVVDGVPTVENITTALREGPYGRCVYQCDNDVVDNQVVQMGFESGSTATFTVVAFSKLICQRQTWIFGTKANLIGDNHTITVNDFLSRTTSKITPAVDENVPPSMSGHEGGDYYLMKTFVEAVANKRPESLASPDEILRSHALVFAAERTRKQSQDSSF